MRKVVIALLVIALVLGAIIGVFTYKTKYRKTEVITSFAPDGGHSLSVYMIGEPDWPFGATHCRFDLAAGGKSICSQNFDIRDDGAVAREENFAVEWCSNGVLLYVYGSEQEDALYDIGFDGIVVLETAADGIPE